MDDGWYLMNTTQLEEVLRRWRAGEEPEVPPGARHLSVEEALAYRTAGNVPDADDRSLRLVLHVSEDEVAQMGEKRSLYEPDFHAAPSWRRAGSRAVNVVPLRTGRHGGTKQEEWWEDPAMQAMEKEWAATGRVAGLTVPGEYRGFVFKTVRALQDAGLEVTADTVADSITRWLPEGAETIRAALKKREPG